MNFMEAVKAMIELKDKEKIRYNSAYCYWEDGWLIREFKDIKNKLFSESMVKGTIWEIIEENKTLSDKLNVACTSMCYSARDVKASLKEFIEWKLRNPNAGDNDIKDRAKEIFGDRLVE